MSRKKKIEPLNKKIRDQKNFTLEEAVEFLLESACAKFDETVEAALILGVDPKKSDQAIRGAVALPNGTGKKVRILALVKPDKEQEAKDAGADNAGSDEFIEKIQEGWLDFDKVIATPDMMSSIGKIAKILGPKGLMPNAKVGTVTNDISQAIKELKAGKVDFKTDKKGIVHTPIGKVSFGKDKIKENLLAFMKKVNTMKPQTSKGKYLKKLALSTTMGPGIKVNASNLKDLVV